MRQFIVFILLIGFTIHFSLKAQAQNTDSVSIIGVGDIMLGTGYPSPKYLPPHNDCSPLLSKVSAILQNADVTFGNLEGCFFKFGPNNKKL